MIACFANIDDHHCRFNLSFYNESEGPGGSMSEVVVGPGWLNELGSCRVRVAQ